MFIIADIDDVNRQLRTAFSRVKDDVTDIRESLSEQLSKIEGMNKNLERYTTKDEFYTFIKKLMQRLDALEASLVKPKELHAVEDTTRARFLEVNERIKQLQALSRDVENLKALKEKVSSLEGTSLDKSDFKKAEKRLDDDIGALQELQSQYEKLEKVAGPFKYRLGRGDYSQAPQFLNHAGNRYRRGRGNYPDVRWQGFYGENPRQYPEYGGKPDYYSRRGGNVWRSQGCHGRQ